MSFNEKYLSIFELVKEDVERVKTSLFNGIELDEPLKSKLFDILKAPSKHIRTVLCFLYLKAAGMEIDKKQVLFHSAIELVHNASLIHDDVIDESSTRRTIQTINSKFDNKLAVIVGDYLLSVALKKIRKLNIPEIVDMFAQTLDDMCQGEVKQNFSRFKIPTIEEYIEKTELKTAKLFETALNGSLKLTNCKFSAMSENVEFARNFGIAFQIRDDLINAKTSQKDFKDGIYTAPVIFAGSVEDFQNGIEKTQILLNNYVESAQKEIEKFEESEYKCALIKLLGLIRDE